MIDINLYWEAVLKQDPDKMRSFFHNNAYVNWHNTNEHFTAEEFICANCEYPGDWEGAIQRVEMLSDLLITVVHVYSCDKKLSFHVTSFIKVKNGKILTIDEYWGDDGKAPEWRLKKKIGTKIF